VSAVLAVPGIWVGRAALAYYEDVSICFSPLKIVSHQERINNAVIALKKIDKREIEEKLSQPQHLESYKRFIKNDVYNKVQSLKPENCCEILQDGGLGDSGFNFIWTRTHSISHFVIPKDRSIQYWPDDWLQGVHTYSYHVYQLTNICGEAVSWPNDIYL
jgi:hypothetical protein